MDIKVMALLKKKIIIMTFYMEHSGFNTIGAYIIICIYQL